MAETVFPAYLKLEHLPDGSARSTFLAEVENWTSQAQRRFSEFSQEASRLLDQAFTAPRSQAGALDLGVPQMREAARAAQDRAVAARELAAATRMAAEAAGDESRQTRLAIAATEAKANEEERAARAALSHAQAIEQVQTQLDLQVSAIRGITSAYLPLAQAEAAAVNGATMLAGTHRNTALELDHVAKSARESAQAFDLLFQAQDARTTSAAQSFLNTALGIDQTTKSARESARAFQEMFQAQEQAAAAQRALQASATQLRGELDPMFAAQQRFDVEMERADRLMKAGTISTREYAMAQQMARDNLRGASDALFATNDASELLANGQGKLRIAMLQSGQQLQDIGISLYSGQRAAVVFAQQLPQLAFALTYLDGSTNQTHARIGRFATFLAGPWGLAVGLGIGVLGHFAMSLLDTGDAADDAAAKTYDFSDGLDVMSLSATESANAMRQLTDEIRGAIAVQGDYLQSNALLADQAVSRWEADLDRLQKQQEAMQPGLLDSFGAFNPRNIFQPISVADERRERAAIENELREAREELERARRTQNFAAIATAQQRVLEARDPMAAARGEYARAIGELEQRFRQSHEDPVGAQSSGIFLSQEQYEAEFNRLTSLKEAAEEAAREARKKPKKERPDREAERAAREAERLAQWGDRTEERIARINERFDAQPRLINQAAQATRELDRLMAELSKRQPPGFEDMIVQAREAQRVVEEALVRPVEDLARETDRRLHIDELLLRGKREEAAATEAVWRLEDQLGNEVELRRQVQDLINQGRTEEAAIFQRLLAQYPALKSHVADIAAEEERRLEINQRILDVQSMYLDATRSVRSEIEAIIAGQGNLANFGSIFRDLKARVTTEALFGDIFRDLDDMVKGGGKLDRSVDHFADETVRAGDAAIAFSRAMTIATEQLNAPRSAIDAAFAPGFEQAAGPSGEDIVVTARLADRSALSLTPEAYFEQMTRRVAGPITDALNEAFGVRFFSQLEGTMSGALYGYASGGSVGGVLGGVKGLLGDFGEDIFGRDFATTLSSHLGGALMGAQTGSMVAGLGNMFGLGLSSGGSQLGGALGSFLPVPGGQIIGAVAGGILGKLFGSTARGSAIIGGNASDLAIAGYYGNSSDRKTASGGLAGDAIESIYRIAEQLGGGVNAARGKVSIGVRDGDYYVDPQGRGYTKQSKFPDIMGFGQDAQAAVHAATMDLIRDGVITGVRQSTLNLLRAGNDLQSALQEAMAFEDVFKRLDAWRDPVGASINELDTEFTRLQDMFKRAGASTAEWADLEELYWLERDKIVREATERHLGGLRGLLTDLTVGNSALSLRDRRDAAMAEYNPLAQRVAAGDVDAYDDFANAARALLEIERQISGSQSGYFDLLDQVEGLTRGAIDRGTGALSQAIERDSPFGSRPLVVDNAGVENAIDRLSDRIVGALDTHLNAANSNLGQVINRLSGNRSFDYGATGTW